MYLWRALHRIGGIDGHDMLINMIPMHVMKMAIMEIIDMAIMADRRMPTIGTMLVGVIGMMLFGAGGHRVFPLFEGGAALLTFSGMFDGAFHQTQNVSVGKRIVDVLCLAFQARGTSPRRGPVPRAPAALAGSAADDDVSCAFSLRIRHSIFQRILE